VDKEHRKLKFALSLPPLAQNPRAAVWEADWLDNRSDRGYFSSAFMSLAAIEAELLRIAFYSDIPC
jgi:hypothetical protein